jgi:hypothetical protein
MSLTAAAREAPRATEAHKNVLKPFACCGEASPGARVQAFVNWAKTHPENWSGSPVVAVVEALRETWPCH